jgi:hypothetical protein
MVMRITVTADDYPRLAARGESAAEEPVSGFVTDGLDRVGGSARGASGAALAARVGERFADRDRLHRAAFEALTAALRGAEQDFSTAEDTVHARLAGAARQLASFDVAQLTGAPGTGGE